MVYLYNIHYTAMKIKTLKPQKPRINLSNVNKGKIDRCKIGHSLYKFHLYKLQKQIKLINDLSKIDVYLEGS